MGDAVNVDVAIVGAGPAGLAAAIECAKKGLATALFDEQPSPGGQIHRGVEATLRRDARRALAEDPRGARLLGAFRASSALYVPNATVWSARALPGATIELGVSLRDGAAATSQLVRARAAILATGAQERPFPIPGWTLPNVMTVGAAQILRKTAALVPQGKVVLAGCGPLLWLAAAELQDCGVKIAALLETTPRGRLRSALAHAPAFLASPYFAQGLDLVRRVRRRTRVVEFVTALSAEGDGKVAAVRYVADGVEETIPVDVLLLHQGVVPAVNLTAAAGCALRWNEAHACFEPVVDNWGGTTIPSLFVAGDGAGVEGADAADARGRLCALAVVNALGRMDGRARDRDAAVHLRSLAEHQRGRRFFDILYRPSDAFRLPSGATLACRCEEVTAQAIIDAAAHGAGPNQMKAFLRCGMGPCQGRYCGLTVTELIARTRGESPADVGYFRPRFPVKPLTLGELAALPITPQADAAVVRIPPA